MEEVELRKKAKEELCTCIECTLGNIYNADGLPLKPSGYTSFMFAKCHKCGRLNCFPKSNAELFIDQGPYKLVEEFYSRHIHKMFVVPTVLCSKASSISPTITIMAIIVLVAALIFFNVK